MPTSHFRSDDAGRCLAVSVLGVFLVVGCGGSTATNPAGDDATSDTASSGTSSNTGSTSSSNTGSTSNSGTSGGSGGGTSVGTTGLPLPSVTGAGGSSVTSSASTSTSGGPNCAAQVCPEPEPCDGGVFIVPDGECCPVCSCTGLDCAFPACDGGVEPIYDASSCCPVCPEPSCAGVECRPASWCPDGYGWGKPAGACCADCIPDPSRVGCVDIACSDPVCPVGYTSAASQGGCCYDCVPDPLYCNSDADCTIADRPRSCCGCPEAISVRSLDDDPCWSSLAAPREIPADCYPEVVCDALCGACAPPGNALCVDHRCTEVL